MMLSNDKIKNAVKLISQTFGDEVQRIHICSQKLEIEGRVNFKAVELHVEFSQNADISPTIRERLADMFGPDDNSDPLVCAFLYNGYLPEDMEVTVWTKN